MAIDTVRTLHLAGAAALLLAGCSGATAVHHGTGGTDAGTPPPTMLDAAAPMDAAPPDLVCAAVEQTATVVYRPIDVIVLPDESSSMGAQRAAVAHAMEGPFLSTMTAAGVDFHVIWNGTTALPMITASGRLTRNPIGLGSGNSAMFTPVLNSYATWRGALRDGSLKVFVQFTDAASGNGGTISGYTGTFDQALATLDAPMFGAVGHPLFVFDTFVGLPLNTPPSMPYAPTDPVVSGTCSGSFRNPAPLQNLAIATGGLRFPLCDTADFDSVFQAIADSAVSGAAVPCELTLPPPPPGSTLDPTTLAVRYRSGGSSTVLHQASTATDCDASSFTFDGTTVTLCPAACDVVEADPTAALSVLSGCNPLLY